MKKRILFALILVASVSLLATGCKKKTTEPKKADTETEAVIIENTEPTEVVDSHEGEAISLLTGEWVSKKRAARRPIAIMTENTSVCQPQYGVSKAGVIYECPVEGGITRMMAIYENYSGMDKIGNVRSCRNYYVYFAKEFDAYYMHCGESHFAKDLLGSGFIDDIDGITGKAAPYFYRDNSRRAPHNLYTSSDMIKKAIKAYGFRSEYKEDAVSHYQFTTEEEPVTLEDGVDAGYVKLYYSHNHPWFEYNEENGLYYRYQFGDKQIDANNNKQIKVKNIIIQNCKWYLWEQKTGYLNIDYLSGGTGKYITNGKCIDITWSRESDSAKTRYFDKDGNEITLNPGKTWVEICQDDYADQNVISATKE